MKKKLLYKESKEGSTEEDCPEGFRHFLLAGEAFKGRLPESEKSRIFLCDHPHLV